MGIFRELLLQEEEYISKYAIGDSVQVTIPGNPAVRGWVRAVIFTTGKVRYSIFVKLKVDTNLESDDAYTTLHNIDSVFISDELPGMESKLNISDMDNYS